MRLLLCLILAAAGGILQKSAKPSTMSTDAIDSAIRGFDGVVGLAAKNLDTGAEILVNPDVRFPTASAIKTAVMLEAWHQASDGRLSMERHPDASRARESGRLRRAQRHGGRPHAEDP